MTALALWPPNTAWRVIAAGQSFGNHPTGKPFWQALIQGRAIPGGSIAVDAAPWATLLNTVTADIAEQALLADDLAVYGLGGQTDIALGSTAQQVYDRAAQYAVDAKAAGASAFVAITLPFFPSFDSTENTVRLAHNSLLVADAEGAFDAIVDIASDSRFSTLDPDYLDGDGHPTIRGARVIATLCDPSLDAILAG